VIDVVDQMDALLEYMSTWKDDKLGPSDVLYWIPFKAICVPC
jgi:hypothetical protein